MYGQEHEVPTWSFGLLQGDLFSSSSYGEGITHQNPTFYGTDYTREGNFGENQCFVETDGIVALQGEFSHLSAAEVSGFTEANFMQPSALEQDLFGPCMRSYNLGNAGACDEADAMEPSTSCSSPEGNYYEGEELPLELTDYFSELDGEVGKRLYQMVPIPHVPRINGEIPSVDEATSDHQRLIERLRLYDLVERKVQGDGNCQFRALSDQIYRSPEHHKVVRQQVVNQLKSHPEIYKEYVPMPYDDYLKKLSKEGEWGDHVTLQAATDSYGIKISVITSFKDTCFIEILPRVQKSKRLIYLSFWAEVHYNSIYPEHPDLPIEDTKKKKRWWPFGHKH